MNINSINFREAVLVGFFLIIANLCGIFIPEQAYASPYYFQNITVTKSTLITPSNTIIGAITVTTDKLSYADGDMITVSGSTQMYIPDTPITVKIISPMGNIVKIDQVNVGLDKNYSTTFIASSGLWQEVGTYHVLVQFGTKNRVAETTFQFTGSSGSARNTMLVEGTDFSVKYSITNGKVMGIKVDPQAKSLIISIETSGEGILTLSLPRELIDAKINGNDTTFYVLVNGQEGNFQETATITSGRILSVNFTNGTTEMEIIGTFVIPEFGLMESMVFTIAVISIIVISSTARLRLASKL